MEVEMVAAATLCCVGACTLALYLYHVLWLAPGRVRAALRSQGIGGPRPSFPYGNSTEMSQAAAGVKAPSAAAASGHRGIVHDYRPAVFPAYEKWRKEYGPIFTYSIGNMVFLHVSREDVVRDLSLCLSLDLGKSSYMKVTHRPLFGDGILKSSGEAWAYQRRLIAPEFYPDKVKGMVDLMVDSARALVKSWEDRIGSGGVLELKIDDDFRAYSADVISRTCFGSSYVKGKEIFAMIRELQKTVSKTNLLAELTGLSFFPTRSNREAWRLNRMVRQLMLDVARESGDDHRNLPNAMLRRAASSGDRAAAENFIVDNCKNIYFAGYESTAVTAAWCMMLLALHPEWQDRVRDEVQQACAAAAPDFTSLRKMKKLTMVIQETLRLYPAGSVVSRQALRDITLGGVRVPAGVNIYVPVLSVHLDQELWGADAREFSPERFAAARPQPHAYLPFGAGARTCLGQGFAMAELKVLLALVLSRFELRLSPDYKHSPALRLIVEPEHGVRLVLKSV
ncbi:cytochrome P450 714B1-like [Phragmites australis]|uniref:cytochrome P450 714B1-like n=1 Tax=Phragmites australis TaxID=29695 RepID=UPI002D770B66|nr:cytochrome P450 714B1-like [Phragmites australis]